MAISKIGEPLYVVDYYDWRWEEQARTVGVLPANFVAMNGGDVFGWEFTDTEELFFAALRLARNYAEGGELIPHIRWCSSTTETYTGTWTLTFNQWLDGTDGTAMIAEQSVTCDFNAALTAWQMQDCYFTPTITGVNRKINSCMNAKLKLSLTAGTSCFFLGLGCIYPIDRLGSTTTTVK